MGGAVNRDDIGIFMGYGNFDRLTKLEEQVVELLGRVALLESELDLDHETNSCEKSQRIDKPESGTLEQ